MYRLVFDYLSWHYSRGIEDAANLSKNLLWFLWNFFSISLLLKTLFSPWKRLEEHGKRRDIKSFFESLVINTLMRLVGAFIRLIFIFLGLIIILGSLLALIVFNILWILMPAVMVGTFLSGIFFLFKS